MLVVEEWGVPAGMISLLCLGLGNSVEARLGPHILHHLFDITFVNPAIFEEAVLWSFL